MNIFNILNIKLFLGFVRLPFGNTLSPNYRQGSPPPPSPPHACFKTMCGSDKFQKTMEFFLLRK